VGRTPAIGACLREQPRQRRRLDHRAAMTRPGYGHCICPSTQCPQIRLHPTLYAPLVANVNNSSSVSARILGPRGRRNRGELYELCDVNRCAGGLRRLLWRRSRRATQDAPQRSRRAPWTPGGRLEATGRQRGTTPEAIAARQYCSNTSTSRVGRARFRRTSPRIIGRGSPLIGTVRSGIPSSAVLMRGRALMIV
jgi:hypothetical protein